MVQNLAMGEADFNQVKRLSNQLVIAAENIAREKNVPPVVTPALSKDMDEQLRLAHKVVDVVDGVNRKICAAEHCGQTIEFLCSSPFLCKEKAGREVSTNCLCQL